MKYTLEENKPIEAVTEKKIYTIDFIGEKPVPVQENQTVLAASLAAGIPHYHACGGQGKCSTCRILVQQGEEHLTPPTHREMALDEKMQFPPGTRLACQTRVTGEPVQVHRIIRDDTDFCLYVGTDQEEKVDKIGEEKELALFFLDIRNFTPFIGSHLPFDVMHILRRVFRIFQKAIEDDGRGKIIETAGDGLYAVFGLEGNIRDATRAAVDAGLRILQDIETFNQSYLLVYFDYRVEVGIGLHVGKVIIGNTGLGINRSLAAMGFPVNVAARLQTATRELNNSFVISEYAYHLLKDKPARAPSATVLLKGIEGEQKVKLLGRPYANAPVPATA